MSDDPTEELEVPEDGADVTRVTDASAQQRAATARRLLAGAKDEQARTRPPEGRTTRPTQKAG